MLLSSCGTPRTAPEPPKYEQRSSTVKHHTRPSSGKLQPEQKKAPGFADDIEKEARRWLGTPYRYGGKDRSGTDCSGMVMSVFEIAAGIKLPRDSRAQREWCPKIEKSKLRKGDLVFFSSKTGGGNVSHVGIYIADGDFIHASTSRGVIISNLSDKYYDQHYHSAGRVTGIKAPQKESSAETVRRPTDEADSIRAEVIRAMKF